MAKDFELVYAAEVKEAEEAYLPDKKQVFYLDDFLGSITLDLFSSRNADAQLVEFIRRVQNDKTKRLILTCRTAILNQAKETSERIEQANLELARHEVVLEDYNPYDKARILYNHIYVSSLPEKFKREFVRDKFYWKIILHRNYNPRIIQFFTDPNLISLDRNFQKSVLTFLDKPEKIWDKPFNKQLSWYARLLLRTLFSFNKQDMPVSSLRKAFDASMQYEVKHHQYVQEPNLFNRATKELEGAYIATKHRLTNYGVRTEVRILNPSLEDYLFHYYSGDGLNEYFDVLYGAVFTEQVLGRIAAQRQTKGIFSEKDNYKILWKEFTKKIGTYLSIHEDPRWQEMLGLIRLFEWKDINSVLLQFLESFNEPVVSWTDSNAIIDIFKGINQKGGSTEVTKLIDRYLFVLASSITSHWQIRTFSYFIAEYSMFRDRLWEMRETSPTEYRHFQYLIDKAWKHHFEEYLREAGGISGLADEGILRESVVEALNEAKSMNDNMGLNFSPIFFEFTFDYAAQLKANRKGGSKKRDVLSIQAASASDEPGAINRLFNNIGIDETDNMPPF
jgi:hypothetical protein